MEKFYELALALTPGVGSVTMKQLIAHCGSAEEVFRQKPAGLQRIPGIGPKSAKTISEKSVFKFTEDCLRKAEQSQVTILFHSDENYPERLRHIRNAPAILFVRGRTDWEVEHTLAIVGTRKSSDYGKRVSRQIVEGLTAYNPVIISGLAYGIDIEAHRAAMEFGLPTIAVMGSGLDIIYPAVHRKSADEIVEKGGALISRLPFGSPPIAPNFPDRNRIVAGLSDAVVVVESAEKGGAIITANMANDYDRDVFAVPGNTDSEKSRGCNKLIADSKARIYISAQRLAFDAGWNDEIKKAPAAQKVAPADLSEEEKVVFELLKIKNKQALDDIAWKTGFTVSKAAGVLLALEFKSLVKTLPGKCYELL